MKAIYGYFVPRRESMNKGILTHCFSSFMGFFMQMLHVGSSTGAVVEHFMWQPLAFLDKWWEYYLTIIILFAGFLSSVNLIHMLNS